MGALDQLRGANGDGVIERVRTKPLWAVAIAAGALLILAWIGWAIYVTSDDGARAGLGVVIAWPAMLAALALISLPFIGGYLLVRRLSEDSGETAAQEADSGEESGSEEEPEEVDGDADEGEDKEPVGEEESGNEEGESEAEASKAG